MLHTGKQRCAAGGLLRDGSQRERQTEAPLDGTLQGGIAPQTVAGAKQPPGGRTSGFERSAVTGGKLVRHAAQQSVQQGQAVLGYYVTFLKGDGNYVEFAVDPQQYALLTEGITGSLTFQGMQYLGFVKAQ